MPVPGGLRVASRPRASDSVLASETKEGAEGAASVRHEEVMHAAAALVRAAVHAAPAAAGRVMEWLQHYRQRQGLEREDSGVGGWVGGTLRRDQATCCRFRREARQHAV